MDCLCCHLLFEHRRTEQPRRDASGATHLHLFQEVLPFIKCIVSTGSGCVEETGVPGHAHQCGAAVNSTTIVPFVEAREEGGDEDAFAATTIVPGGGWHSGSARELPSFWVADLSDRPSSEADHNIGVVGGGPSRLNLRRLAVYH